MCSGRADCSSTIFTCASVLPVGVENGTVRAVYVLQQKRNIQNVSRKNVKQTPASRVSDGVPA